MKRERVLSLGGVCYAYIDDIVLYISLLRCVGCVLEAHLIKLVNYYNYAHVRPRRDMTTGPKCEISPTATFRNV